LQAPYDILAQEDAEIGTTIFSKIIVEDEDTTGANLEVECINLPEYQTACDFFKVETIESAQNSYHGAVILQRKLNYATQQKHEFLLKATVFFFASVWGRLSIWSFCRMENSPAAPA
jgi:hypothetical protein